MGDPAEITEEVTEASNEASWTESFSDENKEAFKGFESQDKLFEAINYKAPEAKDWRDGMSDDLKKTADRFTSAEDAVRSIADFRKRESQVRVPSKDATNEEKTAYYKAIGVPETSEGYEFKLSEGEESTPEIEATNKQWSKRLHGLAIPTETANQLVQFLQEDFAAAEEEQVKADAAYVKESEASLKAEWKGDEYEKNKTFANKAFAEVANRAGINMEELSTIETKSGRFLMDDPRMLKLFSIVGREMAEGTLGSTLTEGERDTMTDQLSEIRGKIEATSNSKEKNRLYQQEQAMIAKMDGNKPVRGVA